jgi:diacylglycerol kinase (ATP)
VGRANGRYFINGVGMGLDAQVAHETTKITRLKGVAVYLVGVIRALASYSSYPMRVRFDDYEVRRRLLFASVANGRCQGGTFWMTPEAEIDDGILDLCLVDKMRLPAIIRHIPNLMEGSHTQLRWVTMGRARHITVDSAGPMPFATDGEVIATDARHVEIQVVPQALEIVV